MIKEWVNKTDIAIININAVDNRNPNIRKKIKDLKEKLDTSALVLETSILYC